MTAGGTPRVSVRVFRGVLWSYASLVGVRVLGLVSTAVLAHLLSPRDFGLVALALIATAALDALRDLGVNDALVVAPVDDLAAQADTAFSFTVLASAALAVLVGALSPIAAEFFRQPRLLPLLALLGLNLPLRSIGDTHYALAQRDLDFRSRTAADVGEVVVRGIIGIGLALAGLGPWSLVLGYLGGTAVWTTVLWGLVRWRPALRLHRNQLPPLIRFGGALTIVRIIGTAMSYIDNLFVGRVLGAAALGWYSLGFRLPEMLIADVISAAGLVLFPGFAMLDAQALRRGMVAAMRYGFLLAVPIGVALIALAHPLVLALFGARWRAAIPVVQILAIGFFASPVAQVTGSAYMARKRIDVMLMMAVPQGILLVALIAIFVDRGIAAVAACQAGARLAFTPINLYVARRVLGLPMSGVWRAAWPPIAAAAGMAAVIVPLEHAISSPWPALLVSAAAGAAVYIGLAWVFAGDALSSIWAVARDRGVTAPGAGVGLAPPRARPAESVER